MSIVVAISIELHLPAIETMPFVDAEMASAYDRGVQ